jgi:translation initiation factor IF-3
MAVRTETVQFHTCDLCGQDSDEAGLVRLYSALQSGRRAQADVCPACQKRPIAELVDWLDSKQRETALRPLRSLRGVGR